MLRLACVGLVLACLVVPIRSAAQVEGTGFPDRFLDVFQAGQWVRLTREKVATSRGDAFQRHYRLHIVSTTKEKAKAEKSAKNPPDGRNPYYKVISVGRDYVALRQGDLDLFVPEASIQRVTRKVKSKTSRR